MGARFVRLGIAGFKSFADAQSLEILPGLTGIVGPNGCGKSNVAEALRWAMGEANARHLRGGEMDDIIFAGSASRPSRNLAEVTLTLEPGPTDATDPHAAGGLPPPFTGQAELQVVRRLERGAGSAYRVNGREARARDVQTLFADLASGARSSAMVSQGRVGALVNARPEERRAVLEEAAGITGLHARRAEAEARLRGTETNLERAEERRVLLARQLDGLTAQASQAARYRAVADALQDTEALLLATQRARALLVQKTAEATLAAATTALQAALAAAVGATAEAERHQAALPGLRAAEAQAVATAERAKMTLETLAAEQDRARAALAAADQRQAQLARDLAHAETTLNDAEAVDARLVAEATRLEMEAASHPALLQAATAESEASALRLREADAAAAEAAARAAAATAQSGAVRHVLAEAEARAHRAGAAIARLETERAQAEARQVPPDRVVAAAAAQTASTEAVQAARVALDAAEQSLAAATAQAAQARDEAARRDTARHRLAAETGALADVLAVKDQERWPPLLDSLAVPAGLEAALGAALGEELAAAANPAAARHWREMPALPAAPTAIPGLPLSEAVSGPKILARALGAVGLVQTDAEGDAAQPLLAPGQALVSAAGAVWRWDGYTVRAGTPNAASVRLTQRNRLAQLHLALTNATEAARAARTLSDEATRQERAAAAAMTQARPRLREAERAADAARTTAQSLRLQADSAEAHLTAILDQLAGTRPEAEAARTALHQAQIAAHALPDDATLRRDAAHTRDAVAQARQRDLTASRALDALQRGQHGRQNRIAGIAREREDRAMRVTDLAGRVADLQARATEASAERTRLDADPQRLQARQDEAMLAAKAAQQDRLAHEAARAAAEARAAQDAATARTRDQAGYAAREAVVRAEAQAKAAREAWIAMQTRVAERETALPPLPDSTETTAAAEDRARSRLARLTRERDEIGPVNLRAEIEAGVIEADIASIIRETAELNTAIAKLRGSIGHLNREGRERLSEVFQQVDRHFQALFSRMFGGGRAHLALVGSEDPLLAGLEIYAQPPGKKLSALTLLSGGEQALTALSLIFAVFRCNPAPLCVLDEVDAPLDDANIGRFCALLTDMVQETGTRFLVVTHHQVTMAAMDRLYGVTMQERGVSRLLSVDLSRATELVESQTEPLAAE